MNYPYYSFIPILFCYLLFVICYFVFIKGVKRINVLIIWVLAV
jgi:hypothetical protein